MPLHEPVSPGASSARRLRFAVLGLLLAGLSVLLWQFRFEPAGPVLGLRIGPDFHGWTVVAPDRIKNDGTTWTLHPGDAAGDAVGTEGLLPGIERQRFVHVILDAAWEDVVRRDNRSWWSARVSLGGKKSDGTAVWPQDGDLINASGSRGWHRMEVVMDLPPDFAEPRIFIENLAATGILRVRNLQVVAVRQRPWIPAATAGLLAAWLAWSAGLVGARRGRPRQAAAALVIVAGGWLLVFPQPHYQARPFPGGFALGRDAARPPEIASRPEASPAPPAAPAEPAPPAAVPDPPAEPPIVPENTASPAAGRSTHPLVMIFRKIDHRWSFAHVAAFGLFGLALFAIAGIRHGWPFGVAFAALSESIPNLLHREFARDDAMDLLANFAGIALAAAVVRLGGTLARRWKSRATSPAG
jgi:hypothetical protein